MSSNITIDGKTVTIAGAGFRTEVTVQDGETIADALERSGVHAKALGVDLLVDGQRRDASEVTSADVSHGDSLAAPPKSAALGGVRFA